MVKKILIAIAALIVVFLLIVATRPAAFHIERSTAIAASPEVIFPFVNDLHRWAEWSPWEKIDPAMTRSYEGGPGVGAKYHWAGNDKVGEGRMTILESRAPERIEIKLEFLKPFEATHTGTFAFKPGPGGTQVTWSMDGNNNFMAKAIALFMDMDQMIGKEFETGLATLKGLAEAEAQKAAQAAAAPDPSPSPR